MIKIIDTYSNGEFNPAKWKDEGYSGVIFKAGQGSWADVPRYHPEWWQQAKDAGLLRGWYWLVDSRYHSSKHLDEMDNFNLFDDLGELGLWADVEKPVISMTETDYWKTPYSGASNVVDFIYLVRLRGVKIGIYTGPGAFGLICGGASQIRKDYLAECELWTAQYPYNYIPGVSQPDLYGSWKTWTWWQWREGPDVNIFNGTDDEFYQKYAVIPPSDDGNEPPTGDGQMQITPTSVNGSKIRSDHSVSAPQVGSLPYGNSLEVLELFGTVGSEQWARTSPGWVAAWYAGVQYGILSGTLPEEPPAASHKVEVIVDGVLEWSKEF